MDLRITLVPRFLPFMPKLGTSMLLHERKNKSSSQIIIFFFVDLKAVKEIVLKKKLKIRFIFCILQQLFLNPPSIQTQDFFGIS